AAASFVGLTCRLQLCPAYRLHTFFSYHVSILHSSSLHAPVGHRCTGQRKPSSPAISACLFLVSPPSLRCGTSCCVRGRPASCRAGSRLGGRPSAPSASLTSAGGACPRRRSRVGRPPSNRSSTVSNGGNCCCPRCTCSAAVFARSCPAPTCNGSVCMTRGRR